MAFKCVSCAASTHVGKVRTNNEDNCLVIPELAKNGVVASSDASAIYDDMGTLLVVADGMGGANAGEVASGIAVETILDHFTAERLAPLFTNSNTPDEKTIRSFMERAVTDADKSICDAAKANIATAGMGTTLVIGWILGERLFVCWCGDSRCYVYNRSLGLVRLSKDHSCVQELVDKGEISEEDAFNHPYSNIITRCLGDQENRAKPDFRMYHLQCGDVVMLCSDGLCGVATETEIVDAFEGLYQCSAQQCCSTLVQLALDTGGFDNVTVAAACIDSDCTDSGAVTQLDLIKTIRPTRNRSAKIVGMLVLSAIAVAVWLLCG